jgi:hypothetical protein
MDTFLCTSSVVVLGEDKLSGKTDRQVVLGESSIELFMKIQTSSEECHCWLRLIQILNSRNKILNSKARNCRQCWAYSTKKFVKSTVAIPITQEKIEALIIHYKVSNRVPHIFDNKVERFIDKKGKPFNIFDLAKTNAYILGQSNLNNPCTK